MATDCTTTQEVLYTPSARGWSRMRPPTEHIMMNWGLTETQVSSHRCWTARSRGVYVTESGMVPWSQMAPGRDQVLWLPEDQLLRHPISTPLHWKQALVLAMAATPTKANILVESSITKMSTQPRTIKHLRKDYTTKRSQTFNRWRNLHPRKGN